MSIDAGNRYNYHSWPYNWVQLTYHGAHVPAKVAGVYRVNAWANTYTSGNKWRHSQLWVQSSSQYYDHKWEGRWVNVRANGMVYLKRGQRVRVRFYIAGSGHIYRGA